MRRQQVLIDITRIPGLDGIALTAGLDTAQPPTQPTAEQITLGPLVTHNDVAASALLVERAFPAGAGQLGGGRAADPQPRHRGRQPDHRQPGQRHHHPAVGAGRRGDPGQRSNAASAVCPSSSSSWACAARPCSRTRCWSRSTCAPCRPPAAACSSSWACAAPRPSRWSMWPWYRVPEFPSSRLRGAGGTGRNFPSPALASPSAPSPRPSCAPKRPRPACWASH